jgi:hypothetical protein
LPLFRDSSPGVSSEDAGGAPAMCHRRATDAACVESLIPGRWPEGFVGPTCSGQVGTRRATRPLCWCRRCRYPASATGSMQDGVAYPVATVTPGISALQRQRPLGLRSPDTAWDRRHRLRKGRGHDARSSRAGLIAADEPFLGGPAKGTKGRGVATAAPTSRGVRAVAVRVDRETSRGSNASVLGDTGSRCSPMPLQQGRGYG